MEKIDFAKSWLIEAERELEAAKTLKEKNLFEFSVYHAQQCAEKALKAVLVLFGKEIYEHSVSNIFRDEVCWKYDYAFLHEIANKAFWLEQHWLTSRYPIKKVNGKIEIPYKKYREEDANKAIEFAEFILNRIKEFLRKEFMLEV